MVKAAAEASNGTAGAKAFAEAAENEVSAAAEVQALAEAKVLADNDAKVVADAKLYNARAEEKVVVLFQKISEAAIKKHLIEICFQNTLYMNLGMRRLGRFAAFALFILVRCLGMLLIWSRKTLSGHTRVVLSLC